MKYVKTLGTVVISTLLAGLLSGCGEDKEVIKYVDRNVTVEVEKINLGHQKKREDGSIDYIDYKGEIRHAPANAAAAEYIADTGFKHTLFDSADNKCQNCHNELYDTWKGSMHGQSWVDPIFQSKFQDFLRTHLAKIGEDKTSDGGVLYQQKVITNGTGVGTEKKMFTSGAALTCIKCHAPGAYYAGDYEVTIEELPNAADLNSSALAELKGEEENSDPMGKISVIAANSHQNKIYKATFEIGHEANREGITCAFCHSIETPRMMGLNEDYTIKKALRSGPHGPVVRAAGLITSDANASSSVMNNFFRLWGPEKPADYNSTSKAIDNPALRAAGDKGGDGRYGMTNKDTNGTNGKIHYTGGPFYGPFGVSGKSNENSADQTDRLGHISDDFHAITNNHFGMSGAISTGNSGDHGKSLCLSCHQRSSGAKSASGQFMELCSTQMAVTTGDDTPENDTLSSPKCQKCHMERIEGVLLHKWAKPDERYVASDFDSLPYALTPELDGDVNTSVIAEGQAPQRDGWFNSHAFLGASKTGGHKTSVVAKIQSGFSADITTSNDGSTLTVTTTITNKTAHMFPGAHPMRRTLTRLIVKDSTGKKLTPSTITGVSTFANIENSVQSLGDKKLHSSALAKVPVEDAGSANLTFPGKVPDLNGSSVKSQKFYSAGASKVKVQAVDATVADQLISSGNTIGDVFNSAIIPSDESSKFTRIYGHETGKKYNIVTGAEDKVSGVFVVRPGFDSNKVGSDSRLSPNETETYTTTYDLSAATGNVESTYKVYYMQKGANGQFPEDTSTGFLKATSAMSTKEKKHLVTEVFTKTKEN